MIFTPQEETRAEAVIESALQAQELKVLRWRDVPMRPEILGEIALQHDAEGPAGAGGR